MLLVVTQNERSERIGHSLTKSLFTFFCNLNFVVLVVVDFVQTIVGFGTKARLVGQSVVQRSLDAFAHTTTLVIGFGFKTLGNVQSVLDQ